MNLQKNYLEGFQQWLESAEDPYWGSLDVSLPSEKARAFAKTVWIAAMTYADVSREGTVTIPPNLAQARAMALLSIEWLRIHAPQELKERFRGETHGPEA